MHSVYSASATRTKMEHILDKHTALNREDIIWLLDFIRQNVADPNSKLLSLPPQRMLKNFHSFAEIAMMMIRRGDFLLQEASQLKRWVLEATHGLRPPESK